MDTKLNRLQLIQNHMLPGQSHAQKFDHISSVLKKTKAKTGYQSGENRPPSTTIGITKSDLYWTIISEGTSINENTVTIEREILLRIHYD